MILGQKALKERVKFMLHSNDKYKQRSAVRIVAVEKYTEMIPRLRELLKEKDYRFSTSTRNGITQRRHAQ